MRRLIALSLAALFLVVGVVTAHPMPNSAVELRLGAKEIDANLTLPIIGLRHGWEKPVPSDANLAVQKYGDALKDYVKEHIHPIAPDGRPWTVEVGEVSPVAEENPDILVQVRMIPPPGAPTDRLTLNYDVIFHKLITHTAIVTIASDWRNGKLGGEPTVLGTMDNRLTTIEIDRSTGSWFQGFAAVFRLGVNHIAEGTDHLLFLLALLLPAPLIADRWRWGSFAGTIPALKRILKIVTAFTIGHSITLILGAIGWVNLPSSLIESAIAVSILVSAIHALVPILAGKEVYIAAGFGLVHGLAFASTLQEFGFDSITMVSSMFAFNLGIEAMQVFIILATIPWLVLLSRTPAYSFFRIAGATITAIAAVAWLFERAAGWNNPIGPYVELVAAHPVLLLTSLAAFSVIAWLVKPSIKEVPVAQEL